MANDPRFTMTQVVVTHFGGDFSDVIALDDNNVIIAYDDYTSGATNHSVLFTRSTDGGSTWSAPVDIDDTNGSNGQFASIYIRSLDGITIYVIYTRIDYNTSSNGSVKLAKSINSGATWAISTIQSGGDFDDFDIIARPFLGGGELFVPVLNFTNNSLTVSVSGNGGTSFNTYPISATGAGGGASEIIGCGSKLMTVYGNGSTTITFASSTDCGVTWNPVTVYTSTNLYYPVFGTIDGNTIWVFFSNGAVSSVAKSTNGGATWGAPTTLDPVNYGGSPAVFIANNNEPTITYRNNGNLALAFAQSANGGATWSITNVAEFVSSPHANYGIIQGITAVDPSHFWILGVKDPGTSAWPVEIWKSNTSITGAFTAPTAFTCLVTVTVHGEPTAAHGESDVGALVKGEMVS